ncbi:hypothetical protein [Psychromonas sp. MB-3u-54]|uniref:hypothetical protein n=1 Tax=Psychromonas sp. MB-3u-54 TaxID=2058319 RepID=UPI0012FF58A9|nr:hypothetical protein [Psychromonas sp. MB-3u-54]
MQNERPDPIACDQQCKMKDLTPSPDDPIACHDPIACQCKTPLMVIPMQRLAKRLH